MSITLKKRKPRLAGRGSQSQAAVGSDESNATEKPITRQARWQAENPVARWSHMAVASAIRRGILTKPDRCEACGSRAPLDAHHDDHWQALDVQFWCRSCHVKHHAHLRKAVRE